MEIRSVYFAVVVKNELLVKQYYLLKHSFVVMYFAHP